MNKLRKQRISENEISEIRTYNLAGHEQKVLLDGKKKTAPIVLYLHGGPGAPIPFSAGSRGMLPEITDRFIMVYWDQLGCGINDQLIDDTFTIEDYIKMTVDLIECLKKDFPNNPVNLFGVSWGSILAANASNRMPQLISKTLVYGQIIKNLSFNDEVYSALEASMPPKLVAQLKEIISKKEKTSEDVTTIAKWINKHTDGYQCKAGGKTPMGKTLWGLFTSPDYKFKDFKAIMINGTSKNKSLYREVTATDLTEVLEAIEIPYFILQGETDIVTSTKIVGDFMEKTQNKNISYQKIKNNGHMPGPSGMDFVIQNGFDFLK